MKKGDKVLVIGATSTGCYALEGEHGKVICYSKDVKSYQVDIDGRDPRWFPESSLQKEQR